MIHNRCKKEILVIILIFIFLGIYISSINNLYVTTENSVYCYRNNSVNKNIKEKNKIYFNSLEKCNKMLR